MRVFVVFAVVTSLYLTEAMPLNDILGDLRASGNQASGTGDTSRVIPEVVADFENFEEQGSSSASQSDKEAIHNDEDGPTQSLSGSGEERKEPLFRASKGEESRFHGEAEQQDDTSDQSESVSGSGIDSVGVNFWPVVRVEPDTDDGGSDRELHLIRRSEISTPEKTAEVTEESSSQDEATSGEKSPQRTVLPLASGSDRDVTSGEDDAPFDTSSADSEADSGCSSGEGCYESEGEQGGEGGSLNSRSIISKAEEDAIASGSASGDSSNEIWTHPNYDVLAGPYDDVTSGSGAVPVEVSSGFAIMDDEKEESDSHEIEDAIFETGIPLQLSRDTASGSGVPSPPQSHSYDDSHTSGAGSGGAEKEEAVQLFIKPQHHNRITLMEKMMKLGKLQAIKISHETVGASSRNEVPRIPDVDKGAEMQSDLGKGNKVSFVLNQDFHSGYENENTTAYSILANSVKREVERALGSNAVVSEISFSEVREPAQSPRFSKVMASLKLLGDVAELEKDVEKGTIGSLVVDKTFFHST